MFQKIVVGTDGSDGATVALNTAIELAQATGAELHVVSAMKAPLTGGFVGPEAMSVIPATPDWSDAARAELDTILGRASLEAKAHGVQVDVHAEIGSAAEVICQVADDVGADLIVVGSRGMKGGRRFLGSVPNSVSHHAGCSVLIVDTGS
ncbi:MAG TPA: universal stress protein [Acidimicrobiia bacterium]|nr:universal stress protein [Acidimicrobiia bacterium]